MSYKRHFIGTRVTRLNSHIIQVDKTAAIVDADWDDCYDGIEVVNVRGEHCSLDRNYHNNGESLS